MPLEMKVGKLLLLGLVTRKSNMETGGSHRASLFFFSLE